jgi:NADP-reducing hydrogenase subunit HndD
MRALYKIDRDEPVRRRTRTSRSALYDEFLGEPLGEKSHELLHTTTRSATSSAAEFERAGA